MFHSNVFVRAICVLAILAGPLSAPLLPLASQTTFIVTKTADTNDGVCDSDCSLREALAAANAAPDVDTVSLPAGNYRLTLGQLTIANPLILSGALSSTTLIHAAPNAAVLRVNGGISATLTGITLRGGHSIFGGGLTNYGFLTIAESAIIHNTGVVGGGVRNEGHLSLYRSAVTENTTGAALTGGGLSNSGTLTLTESLLAENTSGNGGGLHNTGTAWIITSTIRDNLASQVNGGGGIYNTGTLTLTASTVHGNGAFDFGGGLHNAGGQTWIDQSQIVHNVATTGGGAFNGTARLNVFNSAVAENIGGGLSNQSALTLTNSTVANNHFPPNAVYPLTLMNGSGLYHSALTGTAQLNNVTLNGNDGYGIYQINGAVNLKNSIVAGPESLPLFNCSGLITSQDYNFINPSATCAVMGATTHNLTGTTPVLGFLQDNGGETWTHPLLAGSPALETGNPATPGSGGAACETTDQRGAIRPQADQCDMGASEGSYAAPAAFVFSHSDSADPAAVGQTLTYTLRLTNTSGALLTGLRVTDTLPAAVTFASASASVGSCNFGDGRVACGPLSLNAGAALTITVTVIPTRVALLLNSAQAASDATPPDAVNTTRRESTSAELFIRATGVALPSVSNGALAWADYDGDNDLDAVVTGDTGSGRIARLYRNEGDGLFALAASFTGVSHSAAVWGDYDNDNDPDLLLLGYTGASPLTQLYRNDGATFMPISAALLNVQQGTAAWADFDNDGDLDLALTGQSGAGPVTKIYRNAGGIFTDAGAALPGVSDSSLAWGDFDKDGDPDLALIGNTGLARLAKVYRNTNGVFADSGISAVGVDKGSATWADHDGDSFLDLLLAGHDCNSAKCGGLYFYRNVNGSAFELIGLTLASISTTSAWGDYDNDGDSDVGMGHQDATGFSAVYRNEGSGNFVDARLALAAHWKTLAWGDADNDGDLDVLASGMGYPTDPPTTIFYNFALTPNTPPSVPTGLSVALSGTSAVLSWNAASDAQTPIASLTYNVRVGTTPGGSEILSAMADSTGYRHLPAMGNAGQALTLTLQNLMVGGVYYWSVQAIDTAYAGSAFAVEKSFTAIENTPTPTLTLTRTATPTETVTPTLTRTRTAIPTDTVTSTLTQTSTPTLTPTVTLTPSPTTTQTSTPTVTATALFGLPFQVYLPLVKR